MYEGLHLRAWSTANESMQSISFWEEYVNQQAQARPSTRSLYHEDLSFSGFTVSTGT